MAKVADKRIIAFVIDIITVTALTWIINTLLYQVVTTTNTYYIFNHIYIILNIIIMLYFTILESFKGQTIGKEIMGIKVVKKDGNPINPLIAFIRNLTKIFWIPIVFDWLIACVLCPKDLRLLDKLTGTIVIPEEGYVPPQQRERQKPHNMERRIRLEDFRDIEYQ